jgi:hypothetical protein
MRVRFLGEFLRAFASVRPCSALLLVTLYFILILMLSISLFMLPFHMGG